ncbi:MAG: hypothetical protein AAB417_00670 [Patescibacteria group bacterium]
MKYAGYNRGLAALTTMIIVLVILVILIASYGLITASSARQFSNVYQSARAYYVSEAGTEDGIARYLRSGGVVTGSWTVAGLVSGTTDVVAPTPTNNNLISTSNVGGRKRALKITLQLNPIYTYAGFIGDGGLWMSDSTDIKCVSGTGCKGEDEAGDAGTVWVNGPVWANGSDGGGKLGKSATDARVVGHVYTTGKVDIRPSERKEPDPVSSNHKFVCLTDNPVALTELVSPECNEVGAIKATAIAQRVRIHEGGKNSKRYAFRVAYHGSADKLPTVKSYPVREVGSTGVWDTPQRILLEKDIGIGANDERLFAKYKIDTDHDGLTNSPGEVLTADTPEWVYFNIPGSSGLQSVDDDDGVYIVLQAEGSGGDVNSYYKVYYDESATPCKNDVCGLVHTGGYGQYITSNLFCSKDASTPFTCNANLTNGTAPLLPADAFNKPRTDFHFRVYSQGTEDDNYENSLQVFGELHADEAIGASVIGEGSSANKDIAFVGRRFASAFWKDRQAHARLWGYSFVQQLDNCDLGGSGTETVGDDIESRRGWRPFCDSQVRDVRKTTNGTNFSRVNYGVSERRYSVNSTLYPVNTDVATRFYCNPYKNAGNVTHGGTAASCTQDSPFNTYTPYEFNTMSQSSGRGCYFGCGSGENTSCGSDVYKTHYIYPAPDISAYGQYPYNFCKYAGGAEDIAYVDEAALKTILTAPAPTGYGIDSAVQDLYLPKAPPEKGPWPISESKINGWVSSIFTSTCLPGPHIITASQSWPPLGQAGAPTCINGDLVVRNGAKLTLNSGAHMHVKGNLHLVKDPGKQGGKIEMNNSSGALGWPANTAGIVIVDGFVDTENDTQLLGGNKAQDEYMLVISRSYNQGDYDPFNYQNPTDLTSENDKAAIYSLSRQDGGATVSFYAPNGSVVLGRDPSNPNAMQVAAYKLVMRRNTQVSYDYGVLDMIFPGGPASASGVSDYDEIAP